MLGTYKVTSFPKNCFWACINSCNLSTNKQEQVLFKGVKMNTQIIGWNFQTSQLEEWIEKVTYSGTSLPKMKRGRLIGRQIDEITGRGKNVKVGKFT